MTIEIDTSLPAGRVIRTLEQLGEIYRLPQAIRLRTYRYEVLDAYLFEDLNQVRQITNDRITVYNE